MQDYSAKKTAEIKKKSYAYFCSAWPSLTPYIVKSARVAAHVCTYACGEHAAEPHASTRVHSCGSTEHDENSAVSK